MPTDLLVIGATEVRAALDGRESEVIATIRQAYLDLADGRAAAADSVFLRFGPDRSDRIIALPARVGIPNGACGVKWIASFPGNVARGLDRASAVIVMNDPQTGYPRCVMEGSIVSARRTAASAALAASWAHCADESRLGLIGCGVINREVVRFLRVAFPRLREIWLHDLVPDRARALAAVLVEQAPELVTWTVDTCREIFDACQLVSLATNASEPHWSAPLCDGTTVLNLSLRDLAPELLWSVTNIVDDPAHVFQARTSLDLARTARPPGPPVRPLADILRGGAARSKEEPVVFSPFGLGALDLALADQVLTRLLRTGEGAHVSGFFPQPWARPG